MKSKISLMGILCLINKLLNIKQILALLFVFMCIEVQSSVAQTNPILTKYNIPEGGLKVGEKVPEEFWNQGVSLLEDDVLKNVTLKHFRDKPLLIDFWNTWCTSCIANAPKVYGSPSALSGGLTILMTSDENAEKVLPFVKTNAYLKNLPVRTLIGDKILRSFFPHKYVPYYVLINKEGIVQSLMPAMAFDMKVVERLVKQSDELLEFDLLEDIEAGPSLLARKYTTKSDFTYSFFYDGYRDRFGGVNIKRKDETGHVYSLTMHNVTYRSFLMTIAELYAHSCNIDLHRDFINGYETIAKGTCTYEVSVPSSSAEMLPAFAAGQLKFHLPYKLIFEPRLQKVLTIRGKSAQDGERGRFSKLANRVRDDFGFEGYVIDYTTSIPGTKYPQDAMGNKMLFREYLVTQQYVVKEEYITLPFVQIERRAE